MPEKETRVFSRNDPPPVKEKPGFLRGSQKKRSDYNGFRGGRQYDNGFRG
ncbi:Uncharacterized protein dnm_029480 [Desulfonema magnum]|uniref:Uncharacterized protein n=1 Tax=Desulfonema magnum TaxID=45655 RepID=A0A975GML3_9BACT|nr:Uncharacterized protein dnm_029480 [Desulfonema magnum]